MRRAAALILAALAISAAPAPAHAQDPLTIYSSLPHDGVLARAGDDIDAAMRMALEDHGGRAGGHPITFTSLDDSTPARGGWDPARVRANATAAAGDDAAIAYLGDFNSGASALALPITNAAGLLQVSPSNAYVGLTRAIAHVSEPGDPASLVPTGVRTYGRVAPTDAREADALVAYMTALGVRRVVLVDDAESFGHGLRVLLGPRMRAAGVAVARVLRTHGAHASRAVVRELRGTRADALLFTGVFRNGALPLWRALARRHPRWKLLGSTGIAIPRLARRIPRRAGARTYLTRLPLAPAAYPAAGRLFFERFRARTGRAPHAYAIFGYEAMAVVLDAIDRAADPARRAAVVAAFFATRDRDSPLGRYSIDPFGDTTLSTFGGYRVAGRRIVWDRVLATGPP